MGNLKRLGATPDVVATPEISAALYTANDAVGGLLPFTGLFKVQQAGAALVGAVITDKAKQNAHLILTLFNQTFTATADQAAIAVSAADLLNIIGFIHIYSTDYVSFAANSVGIGVAPIAMRSVTEDGTILGQLHTPDTPTYTSTSDIQVRLSCLSDKW
jgi:hypothetical protein